jgi:hypothetical protein
MPRLEGESVCVLHLTREDPRLVAVIAERTTRSRGKMAGYARTVHHHFGVWGRPAVHSSIGRPASRPACAGRCTEGEKCAPSATSR